MRAPRRCKSCGEEFFADEKYCENCGSLLPEAPPSVDFPEIVVGRYQVMAEAGKGGMGSVYLAHDRLLSRDVALKVLHPSLANRRNAPKRLLREARAAGRISHPNVVQIYDAGRLESDGRPYLVMEFLQGRTLKEVFEQRKGLPWEELYPIGRQILAGLAAAHQKSVIHRDLKPGNIFLEDEPGGVRVKLVDFGLSKITRGSGGGMTRLTEDGAILGTPLYMAPEQVRGEPASSLSDLFAVGVILYRGLTGSFPFSGANAVELYRNILKGSPTPPRQRAPDRFIPESVEQLVLSALAADPAGRPQSAEEFLYRLDACAQGSAPVSYAPAAEVGRTRIIYESDESADSIEETSYSEAPKTIQDMQLPFHLKSQQMKPQQPRTPQSPPADEAAPTTPLPSVIVSPELLARSKASAPPSFSSPRPPVSSETSVQQPSRTARRVRELPLVVPAQPRGPSPTQLPTRALPAVSNEATPPPSIAVRRVKEMAAVPEEEKKK